MTIYFKFCLHCDLQTDQAICIIPIKMITMHQEQAYVLSQVETLTLVNYFEYYSQVAEFIAVTITKLVS